MIDDKQLTEEYLDGKVVFPGKIIRVEHWHVRLPNGETALREVACHPGAAGIVALDDDGNVILVRQHRIAVGRLTLEIPAGKLDGVDEDPFVCAQRELSEETGLTVVSPRLVGIKEWMKHGGQTRALVLCYEASAYTGTLTSSAEGENRWMTRAEIAAHPRGKSLLDFLPMYENSDVTSMFYAPDGDGWTAVYR